MLANIGARRWAGLMRRSVRAHWTKAPNGCGTAPILCTTRSNSAKAKIALQQAVGTGSQIVHHARLS